MGNAIDVWPISLVQPPQILADYALLLSKDETDRAERFLRDIDRERWIVARGALRRILGHLTATAPADICFGTSDNGKPTLAGPQTATSWHFNLSHSHEIALVGATTIGPLGIDIEHIRELPDMSVVARRVFTTREQRELASLAAHERLQGFYNGWTRKESLIKATGTGMSQPLQTIEVSTLPGDPARVRRFGGDDRHAWQLRPLDIDSHYVAALAIRSPLTLETRIRDLSAARGL